LNPGKIFAVWKATSFCETFFVRCHFCLLREDKVSKSGSDDETTVREGPLFHGRNWVARLLEVVLETTGSEHRRLFDGVELNIVVRADMND
jgi:hypothetical protein